MIAGSFKRTTYTTPNPRKPARVSASGSGAGESIRFRGNIAAAQTTTAREWVLSGPSETGKTWGALWRLDALLRVTPGAQGAMVRKTRASMDGTVLVTFRRVIEASGSGAQVYGGSKPQWYDYPNGARLWIGGMDDPSKILSGERDFIYVNQAEDLAEDDWETLTTRNTGRGAVTDTPMLFGDCNPGPADHWLMRRSEAGSLALLPTTHRDNPSLYTDGGDLTAQGERTMATLNKLTGTRRQRLRDGLWVGVEGQYFTAWDEAVHTCAPFEIPRDWRVWGAFDYGYSHNTAFYLLTESQGVAYVIGEHVANHWLVAQHVPAMAALCLRHGRTLHGLDIVAGHDVFAQKGDAEAKTIAQQYEALGVTFRKAQIDRVNRAQYLAERLGNPDAGAAATIKVFATCARLIACVPAMPTDPNRPEDVRKTDADAEGRGGDDPYDAASYGLMEASRPPRRQVVYSVSEAAW